MDLRLVAKINLLILLGSLCVQSKLVSSHSVAFIDGSSHKYIRNQPSDDSGAFAKISLDEVAATVSVLLGFAPSSSLSAQSSSKLNEVLLPNPFDKPHAVFMLEVAGVEDLDRSMDGNSQADNIFKSRIVGSKRAELELPGEDEVSVVHLDDVLEGGCDSSCLDEELSNLAKWLGGSYIASTKSSDGELTFPLNSGSVFNLHLAKRADLQFVSSLASLVRNIKGAMETHEDLAGSSLTVSEIMAGQFMGIQVLKDEYGQGIFIQQGIELFQMTLTKLFDLLLSSYKGKIIGVIIFNNESSSDSAMMVDLMSSARAPRLLEEATSANSTNLETLLVRRSLAWITGIILFISTIIGIYLLMNMPLTRDTLLYSNVKLD